MGCSIEWILRNVKTLKKQYKKQKSKKPKKNFKKKTKKKLLTPPLWVSVNAGRQPGRKEERQLSLNSQGTVRCHGDAQQEQ
jgi:hypothetical protein